MKYFFRIITVGCALILTLHCSAKEIFTADYVVVGMGAAGAEITKLLSDKCGTSVIGIEAGANHDNDIPIKNSTFAPILESDFNPQYFYQLSQIVQPLVPNAEFNYITGRLFGGGTSINGMQYVEGTNQLYAKWQQLLGDFWSIKEIRKTFIAIEDYNGSTFQINRGEYGNLNIRQAPVKATSMAEKFVKAVTNATGFEEIFDYNIPETELGPFTRWQLTQKPNGNRESSSTAFLKPILDKSNYGKYGRHLRVLDKTTVLRVLFDGNKAIGVEVLKEGVYAKVLASKKVIICAGIYSPWILQLSGIGPKEVLKQAGVEVVVDNPNVGEHLVNQFICTATLTADPNDIGVPPSDPSALYVGGAFLPDPSEPIIPKKRGLRGIQLIGVSPESGSFAIAVIGLQPQSRGTVRIQSNDPFQIPLVDDGAFTNPSDLATFKNAFKIYIKSIAQQLHAIDSQYNLISPSLAVIDDDAALEEFILNNIDHTHHWTGTCQMGTSPINGVVDKFGNVFGVHNLVVADDSIAPFIPDGNTQACAYLIGRRIAKHIIKTDKW